MKRYIAFALIPAFALPGPALADNCRRVTYAPTYVQPYVAPYYGHDYYQNVVLVPKAFEVKTPLYSYTSVGDEYRLAYFADMVADRMIRAADAKRVLEQNPPPPPALAPGPIPPLAIPNPNAPPIPAAVPNVGSPKRSPVATLLAARCTGCHGGKQAPNLSGDPDAIPRQVRADAFLAAVDNSMPKKGEPLTQEEMNLLHSWAKGGGSGK